MRTRSLVLVGFFLILLGAAGLIGLANGVLGVKPVDDTPEARGEWIFRTGRSPDDGRPIRYAGGMMMRMSCAARHGGDGRGRDTPMFVSPDITYRNLTDPAGMLEPGGERGHTYTDEQIKRAVTQGGDAHGERFAWPMPRWRMTDEDLSDLIAYLRTLT